MCDDELPEASPEEKAATEFVETLAPRFDAVFCRGCHEDLFENNEAFALNSLLLHRELGVPYDKLNVHGGAIALGHPIGASGTRILVTLLHALRQHDGTRGLASICHGTGGGVALPIERV